MRLKTLRKERPAFENEGAVISGSRMDLSNNESKPARFRSNNSFVLPTSLSNDLSSLHMTPSDSNDELDSTHLQQTSANPMFAHSTASQPIAHHSSAYQAIEAAYREHGIRIHLNPTTATAIGQQHSSASDYLNGSKPPISLQRPRVFIHRTPSRSSSALHYTDAAPDHKQDSRPFSALQQTSNHDFEQYRRDDLSCGAVIDLSQLPARPNVEHSSTSILASERSNLLTPPTNVGITTIVTKPIENDPDLAYMSRLLKTTNSDSFRDTIRRRAGLRGTFAVHRHAQPPGNQKQSENSAMPHALTAHRSPLFRHSTIAVTPTAPGKKVEKDILKHASRIRTSHSKECFTRLSSPVRSRKANQTPSMSTSPTRTHHRETKRTKVKKSSKSISLEPLEILLSPARHSSPSPPSHDSSARRRPNRKSSMTSLKRSFLENSSVLQRTQLPIVESSVFTDPSTPIFLTSNESLPSMKTAPVYLVTTRKLNPSNSLDSGCYDRSSRSDSSNDGRSLISVSIQQAPCSILSARLTSASTRHSHPTKKVSFDDESSPFIMTTATYV